LVDAGTEQKKERKGAVKAEFGRKKKSVLKTDKAAKIRGSSADESPGNFYRY